MTGGFRHEDKVRLVKAARYVEGDRQQPDSLAVPFIPYSHSGSANCTVQILGVKDAYGFYPAKVVFRNLEVSSPKWYNLIEDPSVFDCAAYTVEDDQTLIIRKKYDGKVTGVIGFGEKEGFFAVEVSPGASAGDEFYVKITGGSDAVGYSGYRVWKTGPNTDEAASFPEPLTFGGNLYRAASNESFPNLPTIPVNQVVEASPSLNPDLDGKYEITAWGGQLTISFNVVTKVECVSGQLRVTTKTLTLLARDLVGSLDSVLITEGGGILVTQTGAPFVTE